VLYGRTIFKSIRKFIVYQCTINVASTLIVFLGPFLGFDFPLTLIQLLWLNVIMDTLAALAFGGEGALDRYMHEKPVQRDTAIISRPMWTTILSTALFIATYAVMFLTFDPIQELFSRAAYLEVDAAHSDDHPDTAVVETHTELKSQGGPVFLTAFFCFYIFLCAFNAFNVRTTRLNIFDNILLNRGFLITIPLIFFVQVLFAMVGGSVLRTVPLTGDEWAMLLGLSFLIVPVDMGRKMLMGWLMPPSSSSSSSSAPPSPLHGCWLAVRSRVDVWCRRMRKPGYRVVADEEAPIKYV